MGRRLGVHFAVLIGLMGYASTAPAADLWHTSTIRWVYPLPNGGVILVFTDDAPTCTNSGNYHYMEVGQNGMTEPGLKNLYAAALAAAAGGKTVSINFDDSTAQCYINRLYVRYDL